MPMERECPANKVCQWGYSQLAFCCTHTVHPDEGHAKCVTRTLKLSTNGIPCFDSMLIKKLYLGCADLTMKGE